ncbi:DUF262 domain-containing protein [Thermodesulfatator autotrophicus]|uniref:DUF262 domain-containing protein n=1 Tax=Thermodesulfatator autotrophicus TaxID=1795632 RepID=A0A177E3Z4_9BACT|nr:DUF262 domain-containing protein [Thermodesulfatator autotrophicus]OAG26684.1 hypothetical protein TH606_11025 [Thermodesulfatator autotrophicus]
MPKIDFNRDGIGHFLSDKFLKVPLYQRSFAWQKENVKELFDDITNFYPNEYFIGTIVVTDKRDYLEIVDGQQRLVTISLFFITIRDFLKEIGETKKADAIENEFLVKESYREEERKQRLMLNNIDNDFYSRALIESEKIEPIRASHERLIEAYRFLRSFIENRYNSEGLNGILDLVDFIKDKLLVIIVTVSDDVNAFTVFETLNDRGLVLSQTDLIKNYLFNKASDRISEAQDKWTRFTGAIESGINEEEILNYMRYYWSSKYGLTREKELYKNIKEKMRNKNHVITFLSNLEKTSEIYLAILNPNHPFWSNFPPECSEYIEELLELRLTQNRPFLIAILEIWKERPEEVKKALKLIVSWSVRNLITGMIGSGTIEREFSKQAKLINEGRISNAKELLNSAIDLIPPDEQFQKAFEIATVSKSYIARYYLRKIEQEYRTTLELAPIKNPEKVNLEHILPESPIDLHTDWPDFDESLHKTYYRRIGNLTLLDKKMNSDIGNGPFEGKKAIYKESELIITKNIADYDVWSPSKIEERQKEFAKKAVEIWNLKI